MRHPLARDLLLGARALRRRPFVPAILVVVIAASVAFFTGMFAIFDAMLWRPLPYGDAERYMMIGEVRRGEGRPMQPELRVDLYAGYQEAFERGRLPAFEALIPLREGSVSLGVDGEATLEMATWLRPETMPHLQVPPLLGRFPADPDGAIRHAREIAIGEQLWSRRLGRSPDVIGRRVTVDDEAAVIVGVMPAAFQFHRISELWIPWSHAEIMADPERTIKLVGRLAEGVTTNDASHQYAPVRRAVFAARTPPDTLARGAGATGPFVRDIVPDPLARLVLGTVCLVLVAACVNLATLFLARMQLRTTDYATRHALGAGPAGVLRHVLGEIAAIVLLGGAIALAGAYLLVRWVDGAMGDVLPLWVELRLDGRSYVVALLTLAVALAVVAVPAYRLGRRLDLARLLTHHAGVIGRAPKHGRGASALIVVQVLVVVFLAASAIPIAASAVRLARAESGLEDDRVLRLEMSLLGARHTTDSLRDGYVERVRAALAGDPRVEGVALAASRSGWRADSTVRWSDTLYTDVASEPVPPARTWRLMERAVSADYFDLVGLRPLAGAVFPDGVRAGDEPVAVLSAEAARRLFPAHPNPVGRRFRRGQGGPWLRVVGVVGDEMGVYQGWDGTSIEPHQWIYFPERQVGIDGAAFYVRLRQVTPEAIHAVERAVARIDAGQPVSRVRLLADEFQRVTVQRKWLAIALGAGALVTVLFSAVGVFGLVSYYTTARLPELALRITLGASSASVSWLVARGTLRSVGIGLVAGCLLLGIVQRFIDRFAIGMTVVHPVVLGGIALLVLAVVAAGLVVPLWRSRRLQPNELLRVS